MNLNRFTKFSPIFWNYLRLGCYTAAATTILCAHLCSHVVEMHVPSSYEMHQERERENQHPREDSEVYEVEDGRTVEERSDGTTHIYDEDGKYQGQAS